MINNFKSGFATFFTALLVLGAMIVIASSLAFLTVGQQKILKNIIKSTQSYYTAEAGAEDALLRLSENMNWSSSYTLNVGGGSASVNISDVTGGARSIVSEGSFKGAIRKTKAVYEISADGKSFHYGAQIGDGGLVMKDGSTVHGNVFSNSSITADSSTEITGTAKVAQTGNKIDGAMVGQDAYVDTCNNADISGDLYANSVSGCSYSNLYSLSEEIQKESLPISQEEIDNWKADAENGGVITGDLSLTGWDEDKIGPAKIDGNLTVQDQAELTLTGTVWVTGTITVQNKAKVLLDKDTYGSLSGVMIGDGVITLQDKGRALGSGEAGSYLLIVGTGTENPTLKIQDEFKADILFASNGWIEVQNTTEMREVTGHGVLLQNNAEIFYEIGLQDAAFSSGPEGGWEVTNWEEIK